MMNRFDFIERSSACQSGLTCLSMICRYYGRQVNLTASSSHYKSVEESLEQVSSNAEKLGLGCVVGYLPISKLSKITLPCILYWDNEYYVILRRVKRNCYYIVDPIKGSIKYTETDIKQHWICLHQDNEGKGIAIFIKPTENFYQHSTVIDYASHPNYFVRCIKKILLWIKNNLKFYML